MTKYSENIIDFLIASGNNLSSVDRNFIRHMISDAINDAIYDQLVKQMNNG